MLQHIEPFHIDELSEKGFKNFIHYCQKKGIVPLMMEKIKGLNYRQTVMQQFKGQMLLTVGQLMEFLDKNNKEAYDIKRNNSHTLWRFDGKVQKESVEIIDVLWQLSKTIFEK